MFNIVMEPHEGHVLVFETETLTHTGNTSVPDQERENSRITNYLLT